MPLDSDVALLGTGAAPLVAARHLLSQGKSVLILNPDWDFFLEDSELPLDPILGQRELTPERVSRSLPERALEQLRPFFPGALEFWSSSPGGTGTAASGFHDPDAPHVRSRARLWLAADESELEKAYVEASDAGLNPAMVDGIAAARRFPGFSGTQAASKGLLLPKLCDVDVQRYRNGLLEFVRERLGPDRVICAASQIELMPGGIRFHAKGAPTTARLAEGMLVFWTPRASQWILSQARRAEREPPEMPSLRQWEQWSLISRDPLDPSTVGIHGDMVVWAETEGAPSLEGADRFRLAVLRPAGSPGSGASWASGSSFAALSGLCHQFLKWNSFSVRSLHPRALFEWEGNREPWLLSDSDTPVKVIPACDGPLVDVVRVAQGACE